MFKQITSKQTWLVLPANDGTRQDTFSSASMSQKEIEEYTKKGYFNVDYETFNKLLGNRGEMYLIDKQGNVYPKPPYVPTMEEVSIAKKSSLKAERDRREVLPIVYKDKPFDYDDKARERLRIAQQALEDNNLPSQSWTCADNTITELTVADFKAINTLAAQRSGQLHLQYNKLKAYVDGLKTVEEVQAVTFDKVLG